MTYAWKKSSLVIINIAVILLLAVVLSPLVRAQSDEGAESTEAVPVTTEVESTETTEATAEQTEEQPKDGYHFVAQPGDSYTKMARKATQIFGIESQTELSGAQIVFVETNLTQVAGSPYLDINQEVHIEKETVSLWVENAKSLSEEEKARWQKYADNVDFNTDNVGEVSAE